MTKVKNVRPGVLIIADARMRLEPGEVLGTFERLFVVWSKESFTVEVD